jgi:hypothetical protein
MRPLSWRRRSPQARSPASHTTSALAGLKVKAVYEVKDSNRNVAMVIEAQR